MVHLDGHLLEAARPLGPPEIDVVLHRGRHDEPEVIDGAGVPGVEGLRAVRRWGSRQVPVPLRLGSRPAVIDDGAAAGPGARAHVGAVEPGPDAGGPRAESERVAFGPLAEERVGRDVALARDRLGGVRVADGADRELPDGVTFLAVVRHHDGRAGVPPDDRALDDTALVVQIADEDAVAAVPDDGRARDLEMPKAGQRHAIVPVLQDHAVRDETARFDAVHTVTGVPCDEAVGDCRCPRLPCTPRPPRCP